MVDIYWCRSCPNIYTKERSCPVCNTENLKIGWLENGEVQKNDRVTK